MGGIDGEVSIWWELWLATPKDEWQVHFLWWHILKITCWGQRGDVGEGAGTQKLVSTVFDGAGGGEWKAGRRQMAKQEAEGWAVTAEQEKDKLKAVQVFGAAATPEGDDFSQHVYSSAQLLLSEGGLTFRSHKIIQVGEGLLRSSSLCYLLLFILSASSD